MKNSENKFYVVAYKDSMEIFVAGDALNRFPPLKQYFDKNWNLWSHDDLSGGIRYHPPVDTMKIVFKNSFKNEIWFKYVGEVITNCGLTWTPEHDVRDNMRYFII